MKQFFTILFISLFAISTFAQEAEYVPGEILIQINPKMGSIESILNDYTHLSLKKRIAPNLDIYLLTFNPNADIETINQKVGLHKAVNIVQRNHVIKYRDTTPNDPQFNLQWQYINNGGGGGVVDADIDAELAWDITTGGTTPNGDEIVICVVDDGINPNQSDFGDNLWVNTLETPNNGIDDDGNGFIDDYEGYNSYQNNDNVFHGGYTHGTSVAGVVGAKGNNGIGVAGVNWDVKLMIVEGGGNEADALAAYSYPLAMRKLYNATNGTSGAFVVATNSSWGVDFGQASNAPLWCAMYDSMGVAGILSAGATINDNVNVDVQGDLPTQCSSDYLITVTNMQRDDTKDPFAGYGVTTIDIGAHGTDAYTTESFGNGYGPFGGTSGATPHVAGAVGLIYAAPCNSFADLYETDPGQAALKAKEYIMNGGDANASIASNTVSGNRLNLYGTLMELDNDCINCPDVTSSFIANLALDNTQIAFSTSASGNILSYTFRYRIIGTSNWITLPSNTNLITLSGLLSSTIYEYQVQVNCTEGDSPFSDSKTFDTSILSINRQILNTGLQVYPNPSTDVLTIALDDYSNDLKVVLSDVNGKVVYEGIMTTAKKVLNISDLASGVYLVQLSNEQVVYRTEKVYKL